MDESALQDRLERIERRQFVVLTLLAGIYLLGGLWVLSREVAAVTAWTGGTAVVVLGVVALIAGVSRRRRARE